MIFKKTKVGGSENKEKSIQQLDNFAEDKESDGKARVSEMICRSILNQVPVCIKLLNSKGELIEINRYGKYEHYLEGKSEKEIRNWDYLKCASQKDALKIKKAIKDAQEGRSNEFDVTHASNTSRHKTCFLSVAPLNIEGDVYILISSYNISSSNQVEEDLIKKEEQFKEAERIANIGGFEWDIKKDSATVSGELLNILGIKQDYFDIKPLDKFLNVVHPEDREVVRRRFDEGLHDKKPFEYESRIIRPNKEVRILHSKIEIIADKKNEAIKIIGVLQDITERKKAEETIKEKVTELERINKHMIGRELKMIELKKEVITLKKQLLEK